MIGIADITALAPCDWNRRHIQHQCDWNRRHYRRRTAQTLTAHKLLGGKRHFSGAGTAHAHGGADLDDEVVEAVAAVDAVGDAHRLYDPNHTQIQRLTPYHLSNIKVTPVIYVI